MLVGYVSDERYVALCDVVLEFEQEGRSVAVARSTPRGAIYADLEPGHYTLEWRTMSKDGRRGLVRRACWCNSRRGRPTSFASSPMVYLAMSGRSGCGVGSALSFVSSPPQPTA